MPGYYIDVEEIVLPSENKPDIEDLTVMFMQPATEGQDHEYFQGLQEDKFLKESYLIVRRKIYAPKYDMNKSSNINVFNIGALYKSKKPMLACAKEPFQGIQNAFYYYENPKDEFDCLAISIVGHSYDYKIETAVS